MSEEIKVRIKKVVAEQLSIEESSIKDDANFIDDLNADSLDIVELIMALESEFNIDEISDEDAEKLTTVNAVVEYVEKNS